MCAGIGSVGALKSVVDSDSPCYIVYIDAAADKRILFLWSPDNAPGAKKMKMATLKGSFLATCEDIAQKSFQQVEVHDMDDWSDSLGAEKKFKPPPGAVGLPGMGMPMPGMGGRPPPGGVRLPGM